MASDVRAAAAGATAPAAAPGALPRLVAAWSVMGRFGVPVLIALAFALPLLIDSPFRLQTFTLAALNAAVVAPLVLSLGYAGMLNLSQGTFYGLGAYATAILVTDHGWSFPAAVAAAAVIAGFAGMLLSLATARVRGDYFVLISLGLTIGMAQLLANLPDLTRGREGFYGIPALDLFGLSFGDPTTAFYLCLGLLAVLYAIVARIAKGFLGRAMLVVRYDDIAARSMGVRPLAVRTTAMILSSAMAGVAGAFLTATIQFISPSDFNFDASFLLSLYVIIGGMASLPGAVVVAVLFTLLNEEFRSLSDYSVGLTGLAVVIAVFLRGGVIRGYIDERRAHRGKRGSHAQR